ncbi:MAG: YczE/YyaS/YitT family protein [Actinomycetes bacterium]
MLLPDRVRRLAPARTVPVTRWRATSRWRAGPSSLAVLVVGLWLFGIGEALLVDARLGVSPWTVLAQGIGLRVDIGIGLATFLVSVVILLLWIPLREKPGLGTVANAVVIAVALGITVSVLPTPDAIGWRLAEVLAGIGLIGVGSGLYLTTGMGPGPRDGWMTGINRRTGAPITAVRLVIEVTVLAVGWLLGGTIGVGTVLFALLVGPAVGYGLALAERIGGATGRLPADGMPPTEA